MARKCIPYRHLMEDKTIRKVEMEVKTKKLYIKGTDIELAKNQITRKENLVHVTANTFKFFRNKYPMKHSDSWQESNLDGSFAYNGITDDF